MYQGGERKLVSLTKNYRGKSGHSHYISFYFPHLSTTKIRILGNYSRLRKFNILVPVATTVLDVVSLLKQINMSSDKWGHWFSKGILFHPYQKRSETVWKYMKGLKSYIFTFSPTCPSYDRVQSFQEHLDIHRISYWSSPPMALCQFYLISLK